MNGGLLTCLLSTLVFVGSIAGGPQRSPLRFGEVHHAYLGAGLCAAGAATHSNWIVTVGAVVLADDATQHLYQRLNFPTMGDAALQIRSPLNVGYRISIGRIPFVQSLNSWLDRVFR